MASEVYNLYIRILTPVHVGVDKSRDLTAGLDFKIENGKLKIYDHKRLVEKVGNINEYCNALKKGKSAVNNLLNNRKIKVDDILSEAYPISGDPGDLKRQIRDGMNGHPLLPGSSIKGALTSVFFSTLRNHQNNPNAVLGNFQSSLNRFIHCTDVTFKYMAAFNAKIFNLTGRNGELQGGWKHEFRNNTNQNFNPTGFTFAYETIQPGFSAPFTLRFDRTMYQKYISEANRNDRLQQLPQSARNFQNGNDFRAEVFTILYNHTSEYLNREADFFNEFNQAKHSDKLLASIDKLRSINSQEAPVFRLASGSGFHSITGDWKFSTHHINGINTRRRNRGQYNGNDSAKSRRFAFEKVNEEWELYPMGFVQIMTREYYEDHFLNQEAEILEQEEEALQKRKAEAARLLEEQKKADEEASKPQWIDGNDIHNRRTTNINAVVVGQIGRMMLIKPYVRGFENETLEIRYPRGMENGTIVIVAVSLSGNKLQISGYPRPKS